MAKKIRGKQTLSTMLNGDKASQYDYLVTKEDPLSYTTESFHKVILNLEYSNVDGDYKVIQFTSTIPAEGKSTFTSNLAYLLGAKGKKVILIDMDLRKAKIQRVFNVSNKNGLTDYLSGKIDLDKAVNHSEELGIDYILAGEKTSAVVNVLEAKKLKDLIAKLREDYDYVLLDTPPFVSVSDALIISKLADGIIYIVGQGMAKKNLVHDSIQQLKEHGINILGLVLTKVDLKANYGYYGNYSYYNYESDDES